MTKDLKAINKEFDEFMENIKHEFNQDQVSRAYKFAKRAHLYQKRKTGEPFISHPLEVAKIVYELGLDEASVISALLHDVVEDTDISLAELRQEFGEEVEMLVDGLTKITTFGRKQEDVNIDALRKILLASAKDIRILIIKLCDRLHNMRTIQDLAEDKRARIARETLNIYVPIAQKVGIYSLKWELEDLALKYQNPEMYYYIKEKINLKRHQREEIVKQGVEEIRDTLYVNGVENVSVLGRPKNFYSIYKKIKSKVKSFEEIYDLYAVRIITKDITQCYTVLGVLHEKFQAFPNRLKDYIANPKSNGYQSIHTIIYSNRLRGPVEVQIRTEDMHKLAEFGIAAHWRYKNMKEDKKFEKKISWLREVLQWEKEHQDNQEFLKLLKFDFFEDEIFVFTPKNDVIVLPQGSCVIDFAFAIHTDIGYHAQKAKINGQVSTLDRKLSSGDIVEVITNKTVAPTEKWLKLVKSTKAKIKIRDAIKLKHSGRKETPIDTTRFEQLKNKMTRLDEYKKVRKAGCCHFEYGDQIVGVVGKSKELVVHNASCENAKYTVNKKFPIRWVEEKDREVSITMHLKDRFGILIDILNIVSEFNLTVSKLNTKVLKNGNVKMDFSILDGPYIESLTERLKNLDSVEQVKISRGIFG